MRTILLIGLLALTLAMFATPAFCGKPADAAPAATVSEDGKASERWFDYKTDNDIVGIALQEMASNALLDDKVGYGKEMKNAYAIAPVFVESLEPDYPSYYMVSFIGKGSKINVLCIVGVKDGKASLLEVYGLNPNIVAGVYPPVIESEAKTIAKGSGKAVNDTKGKLVFKFSEECGGPAMPAWDLGNGVRVSQTGKVFADFTPESKIKRD